MNYGIRIKLDLFTDGKSICRINRETVAELLDLSTGVVMTNAAAEALVVQLNDQLSLQF